MSIFCFSKNSQGDNYEIFKKPFMRQRGKVTITNCMKIVFTLFEKKPNLQCASSNCNYNT